MSTLLGCQGEGATGRFGVAGRGRQASLASIVIVVLRRREIGHPAFAPSSVFVNLAGSAPGLLTRVSRWIDVTVHAPLTFSKLAVAAVSMLSGVNPSFAMKSDSAIEKHAACAAAISSSGFVPFSFSNRCLKL